MTILLAMTPESQAPLWRARLQSALPGRRIVTPNEIGERTQTRYAVSWRHPEGALAGLPNLRAIFSLGAGVDHLFSDPLLPDAPIVRVVDDDLTNRMSEWVVLHALLHLRRQRLYDEAQAERRWREEDLEQPAAKDVRIGLMGLGALGQDAARKLRAMGFPVAGWSRAEKRVEGVGCFHGREGLDAMAARTDILVALLPLTPETRGILDARLFAKLARDGRLGGPILINAGRGGLQVEADIVAALESGALQAASLDVFETEPLPSNSPLWRHPRVYVSPHCAAVSEPEAVTRNIAAQIAAYERGEGLRHVIDRALGY